MPFDPEGDDYDYKGALDAGLGPDISGHYPSRNPKTGQMAERQKASHVS